MKKLTVFGSVFTAVLVAVTMTAQVFAASNPSDDISAYSYNTGNQSYETCMAEEHAWFDNEDESVTADYSFNTGSASAQSRNNAFAGMPAGDDVTEEELNAFFSAYGIGAGSAYENGSWNESAKASYGYNQGQAAYQQRHASFGK